MTGRSASRRRPARRSPLRRAVGFLVRLLLALILAFWVMAPFLHWELRPDLVEYIVPWLLRPSNGFLSLAALFWIWIAGPGMLRAVAAPVTSQQEPPVDAEPDEPESGQFTVPSAALEALGPAHRRELARALGIPWQAELYVDHRRWAVVVREAARRQAVDARR